MFILKFAQKDDLAHEVEEKLKELSLSYQLKEDANTSETVLVDGDKTLAGKTQIMQHLDELAGELHMWYYCGC